MGVVVVVVVVVVVENISQGRTGGRLPRAGGWMDGWVGGREDGGMNRRTVLVIIPYDR